MNKIRFMVLLPLLAAILFLAGFVSGCTLSKNKERSIAAAKQPEEEAPFKKANDELAAKLEAITKEYKEAEEKNKQELEGFERSLADLRELNKAVEKTTEEINKMIEELDKEIKSSKKLNE